MSNEIRALYTDSTIRVYQAYSDAIADDAVRKGTFGHGFKLDRMTWIKPSFLWMMYRCGWATKEHQERVLAIDIKREAFDYLVSSAVESKYRREIHGEYEQWQELVRTSPVRVQWDPERDIFGRPLGHRSIQIGIRGEAVKKYVEEWIVNITDITDYVHRLRSMISENKDISDLLPDERVYHVTEKTS